jgi:hypothetical protein
MLIAEAKHNSPICPLCRGRTTHRSRRDGLIERITHYLLFRSPYRCLDCDHRFFRSRFSHSFESHGVSPKT